VLIAAALPTHPLLVHIPVVLVPLAAFGAIAIAARPKWMTHYGLLLLGTTTVITIAGHNGAKSVWEQKTR